MVQSDLAPPPQICNRTRQVRTLCLYFIVRTYFLLAWINLLSCMHAQGVKQSVSLFVIVAVVGTKIARSHICYALVAGWYTCTIIWSSLHLIREN